MEFVLIVGAGAAGLWARRWSRNRMGSRLELSREAVARLRRFEDGQGRGPGDE